MSSLGPVATESMEQQCLMKWTHYTWADGRSFACCTTYPTRGAAARRPEDASRRRE